MRLAKLIVLCFAFLGATSLFQSSAQSGRTPSPQPTSTPTPDSGSSKSGVGRKAIPLDAQKYRVVFAAKAGMPNTTMDSFIEQLNKNSQEGYRVKAATYGWQHLSGNDYSVPVAILQSDESEFEYAWFEETTTLYWAIPGFESKYAEQAKKGFHLVDHFLSTVICADEDTDTVAPVPHCESSYLFLLEREKGVHSPKDFLVADALPDWKRKPGGKLVTVMKENLPGGYYPATVLGNNQLLLARTTEKDGFETDPPEVQVVTSSFMDPVKEKVKKLGQQGFRLAVIGQECAVMSRRRNEHEPVVYEWLNAKNKNFEKELARLQANGAVYRVVYRDPYGGNQLVFERRPYGSMRSPEYKVLKLSFQLLQRQVLKDSVNIRLDLTPEAKETVKLINDLARQGFVVRDLFVSNTVAKSVGVLLER